MNDPIKLIYKYKNLNKRIQYQLFIFLGYKISNDIKTILEKIKNYINESTYTLTNR